MYFMSDPQALHVTRNVIPGKLGVDLHLHRVHIPLVCSASKGVNINREKFQNWGKLGLRLLGVWGVADRKKPPDMYYLAERDRCTLKGVDIN